MLHLPCAQRIVLPSDPCQEAVFVLLLVDHVLPLEWVVVTDSVTLPRDGVKECPGGCEESQMRWSLSSSSDSGMLIICSASSRARLRCSINYILISHPEVVSAHISEP